jgi:HAD superfamily hydrolase (TIGR01549 family)
MDSMHLKLESYCNAFDGFGFPRDDIHKLQLASAGLSRQKTIPLIYAALSGKAMSDGDYRDALDRFNTHDEASRDKMVLMNGAADFLSAARLASVPMAIVTGTPQEVIERTLNHFHLRRYFKRIHGTPGGKAEHLRAMLGEFRLAAADCLFIGDAIKDQEAALDAGIPFIGVNNGDDPFRPEGLALEVSGLDAVIPLLAAPL